MKKIILLSFLLCLFSCVKKTVFHIKDKNNGKTLTVFNNIENNIRYIAEGELNSIPDNNYLKINLEQVDLGVGDYIAGCWKTSETEILLPKHTIIIDNNLNKQVYNVIIEDNNSKSSCTDDTYFSLSFHYENIESIRGNIEVK